MESLEILHIDAMTRAEYDPEDKVPNYMGFASKSAEITKEIAIEFFQWCDARIYRADGDLGFNRRVHSQYPEYNLYLIIDEKGYTLEFEYGEHGRFLTIEQVFEEFLKTKQ